MEKKWGESQCDCHELFHISGFFVFSPADLSLLLLVLTKRCNLSFQAVTMNSVLSSVRSLMQLFDSKTQEFINEIDNVHMLWLQEIQQEANRMFSRWAQSNLRTKFRTFDLSCLHLFSFLLFYFIFLVALTHMGLCYYFRDFNAEPELMPKTPSQKKNSRRKRVSLGRQEENQARRRYDISYSFLIFPGLSLNFSKNICSSRIQIFQGKAQQPAWLLHQITEPNCWRRTRSRGLHLGRRHYCPAQTYHSQKQAEEVWDVRGGQPGASWQL